MNKSTVLKVAIGLVSIALLIYFYLTTERSPTYNWNVHFNPDSKDPYGCYLFHELIKESATDFKEIDLPLNQVLDQMDGSNSNYIFLGDSWFYSDEDLLALANFISKGNNAYLIASEAPYEILNHLDIYSSIFFGSFQDEKVSLFLEKKVADITYLNKWEKENRFWSYADSISDSQIEVKGKYNDQRLNFLSVSHGEGTLYLHLTPLAFTNIHLRNEETLAYANEVLVGFKNGPVYWDIYSSIAYQDSGNSQSPLSFILSQESLRWAWYLLLFTGLVYLILYTKRRQRIIPVVNRPKNSSIDFVKTIGSMYYHDGDATKIIAHQKTLFLTYIKTRYGISIQEKDESFLKRVSLKSGLSEHEIDFILKEATRLNLLGEIKQKDLIDFNRLTENFYRNCK